MQGERCVGKTPLLKALHGTLPLSFPVLNICFKHFLEVFDDVLFPGTHQPVESVMIERPELGRSCFI
ncbi:hypothetical protein M2298_005195 [Brevibacillus sp. 1238]|jgi:hypothetical protein|nr:hypothetical protein [Brevibacillus sp. 1238]